MLTMLAYIVFFMAISSGSVFCAARFGRKYEEILPLTCMGTVLLLYIFGILGILKTGITVVVLLALTLYLLTAALLIKRRKTHAFLPAVFTPGFAVFLAACIAFAVLDRGRLAYVWDEFSHWVDIVKVMTTLDDFGTNPASQSRFQSYPPGMTLFEYFLQRTVLFFNPDAGFHEPSVYVAYQVFFASLLLPFFKGRTFKDPLRILLLCTVIFISPTLFFDGIYNCVYIDPILGISSGAGLAAVFLNKNRDWVYSLYIWLLCATLVLAKDSGMLFAIALAAAYCISVFDREQPTENIPSGRKKYLSAAAAVLFVFLPKLLWSLELKTSGAVIMFNGKVDLPQLWQVLRGQDTTWRAAAFKNWVNALFDPYFTLWHINITMSYFALFLTACLFGLLLYKLFAAKEPRCRRTRRWAILIMLSETVIFVFGLCVMYMFKFEEYEAVRLASFTRYTNTVFLGAFITLGLIAVSAIDLAPSRKMKHALAVLLMLSLLLVSPVRQIYSFVRRDTVKESVAVRARYETLVEKINNVCTERSAVYFISQEDNGFDHWVVRFSVRPVTVKPASSAVFDWSIGEGPFYDGDIWTAVRTPEQWQAELLQAYDYVALYRLNDYFCEHYSVLFENPAQIAENAVYLIDKETGLLVFCE